MATLDDFDVLAEREHLMFGLADPGGVIREHVEAHLRDGAPDLVIDSITAYDDPKWMSIARRDDSQRGTIVQFGCCVRVRLAVTDGYSHEARPATVTLLVGGWDDPEHHRRLVYVDLDRDAEAGFDDDRFRERFLAFRDDES